MYNPVNQISYAWEKKSIEIILLLFVKMLCYT